MRLVGGLGNQLFIYAYARSFSLRNRCRVVFDIQSGFVNDNYGRVPKLSEYIINFPTASRSLIFTFYLTKLFPYLCKKFIKTSVFLEPDSNSFTYLSSELLKNTRILFLQGYFQSYKYFNDFGNQIKSDIRFDFNKSEKVEHLANWISAVNSVNIHVRRVQYSNLLDLNYYINGMEQVKKSVDSPVFFVFSDDIDWCKNNFPDSESFTFVQHDMVDEVADLWLMTLCKHHIIANSSFSWWGAWLSNQKNNIIIAPQQTQIGVKSSFYPKEWIII